MARRTVLLVFVALVACAPWPRPLATPSPRACLSLAGHPADPADTSIYDTLSVTIKPRRLSTPAARYPVAAERAGLNGEATVAFVVDPAGRAEPASIYLLFVSNDVFAPVVRELLVKSYFCPAGRGDHPVRVRMEFGIRFTVVLDPYGNTLRLEIMFSDYPGWAA